jgi:leucine dehydrogenase
MIEVKDKKPEVAAINTNIFENIAASHHEQVVFCHDPETGLKAIIAIHNTVLGPALGGTRMWMYKSESEALNDVLRLSRGMTYKAAISGLNLEAEKPSLLVTVKKINQKYFLENSEGSLKI